MSKISIAYVGDKPFKKDTITGSLLVFPQFTPIDVEPDIAFMLLQYPKVWVREEAIKNVKEEAKAQEEAKANALAEAEKQAAIDAKANDFTVDIAGDSVDLAKLNSAKLATLIEAHDLNVEPKGAQESAQDFRLRVRDAIRG
ncbi:hypothetical protein ACN08N_23535 [Photobacterium leiognathi subsp. mandapamensis]|uniref:hypothetical protein n=1 Tax=Photobacterium leiognathi TaxID=553611 RepID=UPI003AF3B514